jgi:hypothetical protein
MGNAYTNTTGDMGVREINFKTESVKNIYIYIYIYDGKTRQKM